MLSIIDVNLKTDVKPDKPVHIDAMLMSQDKHNNQFMLRFTNGGETVTLDDTYTVEILSKFKKAGTSLLTSATIHEDYYATWEFDTDYITQEDEVRNYVYVRKSDDLVVSADANCFVFNVGLSEIDKDAGRVAEVYDENYQKYLDEFKDNVDFEEIAQAEQARKEAEILRQESYESKVDLAIVEADVVEKVDNKVTELTPQINQLTAQLDQKADKSEIGAPTQEQVNAWLDANPDATTTVQDGAITNEKLTHGAVTPDKISVDGLAYEDLYDKSTNTIGYYVNIAGGGNLIANANFSASDFYPIVKDEEYEFFNSDGNGQPLYPALALYDPSKTYVSDFVSSGSDTDTTTRFTAPQNGFVRFSIRNAFVDIAFFRKIGTAKIKLNWLEVDESNLSSNLADLIGGGENLPTPVPITNVDEYSHSLSKPYNFQGKSGVWFGDSITYGMASTPALHFTENGYAKLLSAELGLSYVNRAISGSVLADTTDSNSILNRILNYNTPRDFVFVAGGTNDHSLNKPLGTLGDTTGETVYGALHIICEHFKDTRPDSTIIFITPIAKTRDYPDQIASLDAYRKAIYEMTTIYGYDVIDGRQIGFPKKPGAFADALIEDGVHPSELGHQHYAKTLQGILT